MSKNLTLEIVTPRRVLLETEADYVTIPGEVGELGILPGHIPLLTNMRSGVLIYKVGSEEKTLAVHYGYTEVCQDKITVLAKLAEFGEEIDLERSKTSHQKAEAELDRLMKQKDKTEGIDENQLIAKLQHKIFRSLTRQNAARH